MLLCTGLMIGANAFGSASDVSPERKTETVIDDAGTFNYVTVFVINDIAVMDEFTAGVLERHETKVSPVRETRAVKTKSTVPVYRFARDAVRCRNDI